MNRTKTFLIGCISILSLTNTNAQSIRMAEDFTLYDGTAATLPSRWFASHHGMYSSSTSSGPSGPNAFKFANNGAMLMWPAPVASDSLSFWIKGNSLDSLSHLSVMITTDSMVWDTLAHIYLNDVRDSTVGLSLPVFPSHVAVVYSKSKGNLSFDDLRMYGSPDTGEETIATQLPGNYIMGFVNRQLYANNIPDHGYLEVYDVTGRCLERIVPGRQPFLHPIPPDWKPGCYLLVWQEKDALPVIRKAFLVKN